MSVFRLLQSRFIFFAGAIALVIGFSLMARASTSLARSGMGEFETSTAVVSPDTAADFADVEISQAEREAAYLDNLELREQMVAQIDNNPADTEETESIAESAVAPTGTFLEDLALAAENQESPFAPDTFFIGANRRNTLAMSISSTLAEPAAANEGSFVFYMGNTYASYSTNGGVTYTQVPIPNGPSYAPIACCDPDVIHDEARQVTFYSILYLDAARTRGAVRIWVRPWIPGGGGPYSQPTCSYTINYGVGILPDYPHLGLSNNFLYLATNNRSGASWAGSQVRRYNLDQMSNCEATSFRTFTWNSGGTRVFVPVEGARETMYWGMLNTTTSFRIFEWKESSTSVSTFNRGIARSYHTNPDCRGGTGNNDFIERFTAWSIAGFRMRGARAMNPNNGTGEVWFWWNSAGNGGSRPQAFIRAVRFRESDKARVGQPDIWNPDGCFGYPVASMNKRGHLGLSLAFGGRDGGGGAAAQGSVGIVDDYNWPAVTTVFLTAQGTHNRADGRFGDYFTVRPFSPCDFAFAATNYAYLNGNTLSSHVNTRYINFMRERDRNCYLGWRNLTR